MTVQARVIALLVVLLAFIATGAGAYWVGHRHGDEAGAQRVQAKWDKANKDGEAETKRVRGEGFDLAAKLEADLTTLEKRYAANVASQRAAKKLPFECPKSGEIGDVVVPAALVHSMFNRSGDGLRPPGPAASQPVD